MSQTNPYANARCLLEILAQDILRMKGMLYPLTLPFPELVAVIYA